MIHAPVNTVFVTIAQKFYDKIEYESGITLYHDTTYHPEEHAMLEGTVVSLPDGIIEREDYKGFTLDLEPGDQILMRYDVVFAFTDQPDRSTAVYKNLLFWEGQEIWQVDIQKIFAVVRKDAIRMLNGYVLCELYIEHHTDGILIIPEAYRDVPKNSQVFIRAIGPRLPAIRTMDLQVGDRVACVPGVAQHYQINTKKFCILKRSHILGKYT